MTWLRWLAAIASACLLGAPEPAAAALPGQIPMQLPFPVGQAWMANGPHANGTSGVRKSVDFGRTGQATGTVVAVAAGTVSSVVNCGGGYEIRINHADGWQSGYLHLASASVPQGATVSMGQVIGTTGLGCGANGFNHVHLSIRRNGADVNIDGLDMGGHTLHAKTYNYGGYWTRNSDGALVVQDVNENAQCCLTSLAVGGPRPDGSFIRTPSNGAIYRIVGGAPIHVHTCAPLNGCAGVVNVDSLAGYAAVPRNGSFIRVPNGPYAGLIARVAGGKPIGLATCAPLGGCAGFVEIDQGGYESYAAAHPNIADGTFVRVVNGPYAGLIARVAGGKPIGLATCAPLGGCAGVVEIDQGGYESYAAAHPNIADGTFVRVADGANAGLIARAAGGRLLGLTDCSPLGGCAGHVNVDSAGFDAYQSGHPSIAHGTMLRALPSGSTWLILSGLRSPIAENSAAISVNDATVAAIPVATADPPADTGATGGAGRPDSGQPSAPPAAAQMLRVSGARLRKRRVVASGVLADTVNNRLTVRFATRVRGRTRSVTRVLTAVDGEWRVVLQLPRRMQRARKGRLTIHYAGNAGHAAETIRRKLVRPRAGRAVRA